jgi:hypothetical protein
MQANIIEYKRCLAIACNVIVKRKCSYKQEFLSSAYASPIGVAWRKIRLMRSHYIMPAYPGNLLHTKLAKANLFCRTYQESGQSGQIRAPANLLNLIISSWADGGDYIYPFTRNELI